MSATKRVLLVMTSWLLLWGCASTLPTATDMWLDSSAKAQAKAIQNGELTSEALVRGYLSRIDNIDSRINSILSLNPNAVSEAQALDAMAKQGQFKGPLHGIPVLLKDNIESRELPTTAGSMALLANDTKRDAPIVARLRNAGAIILGKTNLSQWANFRSESSTSGWSAVGGLTRNPFDLSRTACGSSSGSGAAMAAGLASLAVGTETNGSIICPSSMNGIVGFKPTVGLLSRTHIVPISHTQDTAGPMVRYAEDAFLMAQVMAGEDEQDSATRYQQRPDIDSAAVLPLAGARIGVARYAQGNNAEIIAAFDEVLNTLSEAGAELVDIEQFEPTQSIGEASYQVLLAEFKTGINHYLSTTPDAVTHRDLAALIAFNRATQRELALFDQSIFEKSEATAGATGQTYEQALSMIRQVTREQGLDKVLADNQVDFLVAPSNNPAFLIDLVYGDNAPAGFIGIGYYAAIAGYPHLTQPMGQVDGLPIGFSIVGGQWQDQQVLALGASIEALIGFKPIPLFASDSAQLPGKSGLTSPLE